MTQFVSSFASQEYHSQEDHSAEAAVVLLDQYGCHGLCAEAWAVVNAQVMTVLTLRSKYHPIGSVGSMHNLLKATKIC